MACVAFWLVSALFLGIGAIAANPSPEAEHGFVGRIGDERAAAGLAGYAVAADLVEVARRHAEEMRRQQRLHHNPSLGEDVQGWQAVGENVGVGPTVEAIHQKFMESPSHRDNILSGRFTEVGVGVVVDGDDLWVVQVFRLPQSSSGPPPEPAPAAPPAESSPPAEPDPAPRTQPEPRPAPSPGVGGTGAVRATSSAPTPAPGPATTAAPPTTAATAADTPQVSQVPTSLLDASPSTADTTGVTAGVTQAPAPAGPDPVVDVDDRSAGERQVTWPVATAATMLLGVVIGLSIHVGGFGARPVAAGNGRRTSLLDVWELALAR